MFKTIKQFIQEAIRELGRVTWPDRTAVLRLTVGVAIVSVLFGLFAGLADFSFTTALRQLLVFKESHSTSQSTNNNASPIQVNPGDVQVETTPAE
jgi:preprotein translocase SecE subunit